MKLLKNERTEKYHEIEVEYSFLWIKWRQKYRMVGNSILGYKDVNKYFQTGMFESMNVKSLFYVNL